MRYSLPILITFFLLWSSSCDSNEESACSPPNKPTFSLEDLNPSSETYGENIGPQYFTGNGIWDEGEPWTDLNNNGEWDWDDTNGDGIVDDGESEEWAEGKKVTLYYFPYSEI